MTIDLDGAARIVQLALTPIFFLAGLSTLLNVFTVRLGRIADRVDRLIADSDQHGRQLARLRLRSRLLDGAVLLCAFAGALTCAAAFVLFLGSLDRFRSGAPIVVLFGGALACAIAALGCFSIETVLSGQSVREESRSGD